MEISHNVSVSGLNGPIELIDLISTYSMKSVVDKMERPTLLLVGEQHS
jgi:hypothetical protein